jgi:hypothetical protein
MGDLLSQRREAGSEYSTPIIADNYWHTGIVEPVDQIRTAFSVLLCVPLFIFCFGVAVLYVIGGVQNDTTGILYTEYTKTLRTPALSMTD